MQFIIVLVSILKKIIFANLKKNRSLFLLRRPNKVYCYFKTIQLLRAKLNIFTIIGHAFAHGVPGGEGRAAAAEHVQGGRVRTRLVRRTVRQVFVAIIYNRLGFIVVNSYREKRLRGRQHW